MRDLIQNLDFIYPDTKLSLFNSLSTRVCIRRENSIQRMQRVSKRFSPLSEESQNFFQKKIFLIAVLMIFPLTFSLTLSPKCTYPYI